MYKPLLATCLVISAAACSSPPQHHPYDPTTAQNSGSHSSQSAQSAMTTPANYNNNNAPANTASASSYPAKTPVASSSNNAAIVPDGSQQAGQLASNEALGTVQRQQGNVEVPTQKVIIQHTTVPTVTETKIRADINRMTASDFKALGLSEDEANQVILYRTQNGPFESVNDLAKVPDISLNWLADNHRKLAVDPMTTG